MPSRFVETFRETPWGSEVLLFNGADVAVKIIVVHAGHRLSLQSHRERDEYWTVLSSAGGLLQRGEEIVTAGEGTRIVIPRDAKHRLSASKEGPLRVLEICIGRVDPNDIIRYEDDYGRC